MGVAHERGVQDGADFGAFGDTLECLAVHARGGVLEQRGDDAVFTLGDQCAGDVLANVRPLRDGHHVILRFRLDHVDEVGFAQRLRMFKDRAGDFDDVHRKAAGRALHRHVAVICRSSSRRFSLEPSLARSSSNAKLLAGAAMPDLPSGRRPNLMVGG